MNTKSWPAILVVAAVVAFVGGLWYAQREPAPPADPPSTNGPDGGSGARAPIPLGAVLPLSGAAAPIGNWQRRGLDLAAAALAAEPSGLRFKMIYEDSAGDPKTGLSATEKILATSRPPALFLSTSGVSNAALPSLNGKQVLGLLLAVSLPDITDRSPWAVRFNLGSEDEALAMAAHLETTTVKKVAVAYINDEFGVGANTVFAREATLRGLTVTASEAYEKDSADFRTLATKLRATRPDAFYVIGYLKSAVILIQQLRELGAAEPVLGNMALSVPSFLEQGGAALDGALFTVTAFDPASTRPETARFVADYRARYDGETPTFFAAFAYDALKVLARTFPRDAPNQATGETLRKAIVGLAKYEGVMGKIAVDADREVTFPIRVVENKGGRLVEAAAEARN